MAVLQFSLWNFVRYNVFGGGDSALYGVEGPSFYMRNGLNNLNFILPLGLIYPLVALLDLFQVTGELLYLLLWKRRWLLHLLHIVLCLDYCMLSCFVLCFFWRVIKALS